jgi:periodic tryptophan protein 1
MISALTWVPRGGMRRIPHAHDPTTAEVEAARARAAVEAEATDEPALLSDPAFASIRNVPLPAEFEKFDRMEAAMAGGGGGGGGGAQRGGGGAAAVEEEEEEEELEEEDREDLVARPSDAFVVVANTQDDFSGLEVYVYNEEDGNLFVRHDVSLPSFPVCLAWMDYAGDAAGRVLLPSGAVGATAEGESYVGSFCAVGTFDPSIEVWNLDVVDPLEPTLVLAGEKQGKGKKGKGGGGGGAGRSGGVGGGAAPGVGGHSGPVVGLSWNRTHRHLLASSSEDGTARVWDLDGGGRALYAYTHHAAKVSAVAWNPVEATVLAMASADRTLSVTDARSASGAGAPRVARYALPADPESLLWYPHNAAMLLASCSDGNVVAYDVRSPAAPLWTLKAHGVACTSLAASQAVEGLLATASLDKTVKLWDVRGRGGGGGGGAVPMPLSSKALAVGKVFSASFFPNQGFLIAAGGSKGLLAVWDTKEDAGDVTAELVEAKGDGVDGSLIAQHFAGRGVQQLPGFGTRGRVDA